MEEADGGRCGEDNKLHDGDNFDLYHARSLYCKTIAADLPIGKYVIQVVFLSSSYYADEIRLELSRLF